MDGGDGLPEDDAPDMRGMAKNTQPPKMSNDAAALRLAAVRPGESASAVSNLGHELTRSFVQLKPLYPMRSLQHLASTARKQKHGRCTSKKSATPTASGTNHCEHTAK